MKTQTMQTETPAQRVLMKVMEKKAIRDARNIKSAAEPPPPVKPKRERVGKDIEALVAREVQSMAALHLDAWKQRYSAYNKVAQIRADLAEHDPSLEIEHAEDRLGRKLNDTETGFLVRRFNIEVAKQGREYINPTYNQPYTI